MTFDRAKLFSTKDLTEKTISACGMEFTVHVRRLPAVDLRRYQAELLAPDIDTRMTAGFDALQKSIRNADGSPFATVAEFSNMDAEAIKALMDAFTEINRRREDPDLGNA